MPDWAGEVRRRLSSLHLTPTREAEIVDELSQHLDDRWRELIAGGASPEEATRLTRADFRRGGLLAKYLSTLRQAHPPPPITPGAPPGHALGDLYHDVRYAARTLRKQPAFTVAAVLTLALGIGSNAAMFSVINAVLLRPLPFAQSEQLVAVYSRYLPATGYDFPFFAVSGPEFSDIRSRVNAFAGIAAYQFSNRNLAHGTAEVERVLTMSVTAQFFDVLGVRAERGRIFSEDEARPGGACVALLAHGASARSGITVGSAIRLDDAPCEVIGVMPADFGFSDDRVKVWTTLQVDAQETPVNRQSHGLLAIARLRDGVNREQADAQLQSLRADWSQTYPEHYAKGHFAVSRSLQTDLVGDQRDALLLLGGAVVFVLLIVCVNLAGLLTAKGEARRSEFALRSALGANRGRLVRQMVVEAMLLAVIGGVMGVMVANALLAGLLALYPERLPVWQPITIDHATLFCICVVTIMAGFLVGVVPALNATRSRMQQTLRAGSRTATGSRRALTAGSVLVVSQLALSVVLLVGAVLLIRSYERLQAADLGIEPDRLLTFSVFVPRARQEDSAAARRTLASIEERLSIAPGIEVAGAISGLPLASPGPPDDFVIEGRPTPPPGAPAWNARYLMATPRSFRALGIPLKRGRLLGEDDMPGRPLVAVINETAARLYWPDDDPIGRTIRYYPYESSPSIQIVGVVGDVRSLGASEPAPPAVYVPFTQAPRPSSEGRMMTFVVRVTGSPAAAVASARAAVASIDSGLPLANVRTMSEVVSVAAGQPRFTTIVMSFFAGVGFVLAAVGLYGVLSYTVEQRRREVGVRLALGADKREIVRLVVGQGVRLTIVGVIAGVPAAMALTRLMGGALTGITNTDPVTYIAVVVLLATSTMLASYLPARRATRVDPIIALRAD